MSRRIRAHLEGVDAEPGRVAAGDVARIIIGLERAIARAAYVVLGKPRRKTGRHSQAIENASRLRFVGVDRGSFVEVLALPDSAEPTDNELPISVADLSSQAFDRLLEVITSKDARADSELAEALAQMAAELGIGDRNTSITFIDELAEQELGRPRRATIDAAVRERMQLIASQPPLAKEQVVAGVLVEADFEGHTARLRLPQGDALTVSFSPELADDIHEALRVRSQFDGLVHYHPKTSLATRVELRQVFRSTQLALDEESFWRPLTFSELQTTQGTSGRVGPKGLALNDLSDDERAAFLAALAE